MDAIVALDALDATRNKRCILTNGVVLNLEYAEKCMGMEREAREIVRQVTAAKKILGCSNTATNTALRAALGMYPLQTKRETCWKLKWHYQVWNMPKQRLPAIADGAVWEKATKARAGIRWDGIVERVWKDTGGNQEDMTSAEKFGRYTTDVEESTEKREMLALRNKVKSEKHLGDMRGG